MIDWLDHHAGVIAAGMLAVACLHWFCTVLGSWVTWWWLRRIHRHQYRNNPRE